MAQIHISEEEIRRFHSNAMAEPEYSAFLTHIGSCTFCAQRFSKSFQAELLPAPANLKERILDNAAGIRIPKHPIRNPSKKRQLFWYSTRVCVSVCGALILLMSISLGNGAAGRSGSEDIRLLTESSVYDKDSVFHWGSSFNEMFQELNRQMEEWISTANGHSLRDIIAGKPE